MKKLTILSLLALLSLNLFAGADKKSSEPEQNEIKTDVEQAFSSADSTAVDSVTIVPAVMPEPEQQADPEPEPEPDPLVLMAKANSELILKLEEAEKKESELNTRIESLMNESKNKDQEIISLKKVKREYESLKKNLADVDEIVWKQCLLYPLERRCDTVRIEKATAAVESFEKIGRPSKDFIECKTVYEPLLKSYKTYNSELSECLNEIKKSVVNLLGGKIKEGKKDIYLGKIKNLSYYPLYEKRNDEPWQSIPYLDDAYTTVLNIINKLGNADEIQAVIDQLTPEK